MGLKGKNEINPPLALCKTHAIWPVDLIVEEQTPHPLPPLLPQSHETQDVT
jgi:hypothetical protein